MRSILSDNNGIKCITPPKNKNGVKVNAQPDCYMSKGANGNQLSIVIDAKFYSKPIPKSQVVKLIRDQNCFKADFAMFITTEGLCK